MTFPGSGWRRAVLFLLVATTVAAGVELMVDILRANGMSPLETVTLGLFAVTFAWISIAFWTAVAGFGLQLLRLDPLSLRRRAEPGPVAEPIVGRTVLAMPVFNEDVDRVAAGIEAVWRDLHATGSADAFDLFLLSDSTDDRIAARERAAVADLRHRMPGGERIRYRRREDNEGRKAGNIAEFCRRWGAYYDYMVVLDADSVMTGDCLVRLARAMQANPSAGIIQTVPIPVRQETFFGRFLQFAAALYSPMLAAGMSFWQTDTANYWGHNAIIRVAPFMAHCGLPRLPGKPPLGGEILSHDFVEAALMRRAGWHVYLLTDVEGSHEEVPGNVLDYAKRDRRWSEGNLQHMRLLGARGLHPLNRLYFLMGALAYGCSLLWLLMLTVSTLDAGSRALTVAEYFGSAHQLFPDWPVARTGVMILLLATVAGMLILPKVFGLLLALISRSRRRAFGGGWRLAVSAVVELVFSIVIAPIMMTFHAFFVASVLCGRKVRWQPQNREGRAVAWSTAWRATGFAAVAGVFWGLGTAFITPIFFWALTPVLSGLVLAPALVAWSSSTDLGRWCRRRGLFLTPAETRPPSALARLAALELSPRPPTHAVSSASLPLPETRYRPMPVQRLDEAPLKPRDSGLGA
ncbi:glucans biosynthesis glucosyltransferase MdoH [Ectothiorhodospiraceae bacterium WFHF3C12]|nr:glucans biosynthesis glucosyltransferase MdoH [Ectothiorhodospiraceae bacterium WFHF3C12]